MSGDGAVGGSSADTRWSLPGGAVAVLQQKKSLDALKRRPAASPDLAGAGA